jgi:hypothetical protein
MAAQAGARPNCRPAPSREQHASAAQRAAETRAAATGAASALLGHALQAGGLAAGGPGAAATVASHLALSAHGAGWAAGTAGGCPAGGAAAAIGGPSGRLRASAPLGPAKQPEALGSNALSTAVPSHGWGQRAAQADSAERARAAGAGAGVQTGVDMAALVSGLGDEELSSLMSDSLADEADLRMLLPEFFGSGDGGAAWMSVEHQLELPLNCAAADGVPSSSS